MHPVDKAEWRRATVNRVLIIVASLMGGGLLAAEEIPKSSLPGPLGKLRAGPARELFASRQGQVQLVRIEISQDGLQSLRDQPRRDVRARVQHQGITSSNVAIHLKGRTGSFRAIDDKPGLTLDFDQFDKTHTWQGLTKVHLDNSVEDPAYLNANLGAELFRRAGLPAARVVPVEVQLNGRSLGLYVLREGFTPEFLSRYFAEAAGSLYEPVPSREGPQWRRMFGPAAEEPLAALLDSCKEPNLERRAERLLSLLDVDGFLTFMALEVMVSHRDGYSLAGNNYRLYHDPATSRFVFLPHGMDQLFGRADLPMRPQFSGPVARALMEIPAVRTQYWARAGQLFTNLLKPQVADLARQLSLSPGQTTQLTPIEKQNLETAVSALHNRIAERLKVVQQQLQQPFDPVLLAFSNGAARLETGWRPVDSPADGKLDQETDDAGRACLHIRAGAMTSASWRLTRWLEPGRYRLEGQARTAGVQPLPNSRNKGAGLRLTGVSSPTPHHLTGDSTWTLLKVEFEISGTAGEREFVCELRASAGDAWFDLGSLQVVRVP